MIDSFTNGNDAPEERVSTAGEAVPSQNSKRMMPKNEVVASENPSSHGAPKLSSTNSSDTGAIGRRRWLLLLLASCCVIGAVAVPLVLTLQKGRETVQKSMEVSETLPVDGTEATAVTRGVGNDRNPPSMPSLSLLPVCRGTAGMCATDYETLLFLSFSASPGDTIAICGEFVMEASVTVHSDDITICCVEGSRCTLMSESDHRNLVVRGRNAMIAGISFVGGSQPKENGGSVWIRSTGHVEVRNCAFRGGNAIKGGNLHVQNAASLVIANSRFEFGTADEGGGVSLQNVYDLTITGSYFDSNRAGRQGGGILHYTNRENAGVSHTINLSLNRFISNGSDRGGAFYLRNLGDSFTFSMVDSFFRDNSAAIQGGVGYIRQNSTVSISAVNNLGLENGAIVGSCTGIFLKPSPVTGEGNECLDVTEPILYTI